MPGYALGFIETEGLPAAIEATDTALKSANVRLIGYELATGGLVTVKIEGEVSAVDAAVRSGSAAASRVNRVQSTLVIARPGIGLDRMVMSEKTTGAETAAESAAEPVSVAGLSKETDEGIAQADVAEAGDAGTVSDSRENDAGAEPHADGEQAEAFGEESTAYDEEPADEDTENEGGEEREYTCNLCRDPMCTRRKGQPRASCIHYEKV